MNTIRSLILAAATLLIFQPGTASAQDPFIFPLTTDQNGNSGRGLAWWLRDSIIRPTSTLVSGISVAELNRHRGEAAGRERCSPFSSPSLRMA